MKDSGFALRHASDRAELGLDSAYDQAGPAARIRLLMSDKASSPDSITTFLNAGAQVNALRLVQGSFRCDADGAHRRASFCDLFGTAYFPPHFYARPSFGGPFLILVVLLEDMSPMSPMPVNF